MKEKSRPTTYDWCKIHGDISTTISTGGIRIRGEFGESNKICPFCFVEWLNKNFPTEQRNRNG